MIDLSHVSAIAITPQGETQSNVKKLTIDHHKAWEKPVIYQNCYLIKDGILYLSGILKDGYTAFTLARVISRGIVVPHQ